MDQKRVHSTIAKIDNQQKINTPIRK